METRNYWEENGIVIKYDNYGAGDGCARAADAAAYVAAASDDEAEFPPGAYFKKGKVSRQDPLSHRIIEKRRRDRMNNCLADLARLVPPEYLKKGRGRVEKTEIIEMAIRHLNYLQERASASAAAAAAAAGGQQFQAGYELAAGEAVRFLAAQRGPPAHVARLADHLQRHADRLAQGSEASGSASAGSAGAGGAGTSSSETASSCGSSRGASRAAPVAHFAHYDHAGAYAMDCDRAAGEAGAAAAGEVAGGGAGQRAVRKADADDCLHSYKFKNCIERRFSRSQDCEAAEQSRTHAHAHGKLYTHKRRRAAKLAPPASTSASAEDTGDHSPQGRGTPRETPHAHGDAAPAAPLVPVFALNALGKCYVPLRVPAGCLAAAGCGALAPGAAPAAPLHAVSISVDFQRCDHRVKHEPLPPAWHL